MIYESRFTNELKFIIGNRNSEIGILIRTAPKMTARLRKTGGYR